ncbi:MAG: sodium:solute symporter family protein [Planctomycetes bacterium]|nr:sodium:solute symporter family protein [Planctomycetota bacterium]MBL7041115.1 sodium:solute symporter family protein [Pirellulaceae bacterium]
MAGLHLADLSAVAVYFVIIVAVGVWSARRVTSLDDFVMPRRFGKVFMIFFTFGAGTHSDQAVSVASKTYTNGVSGIWYQWLWLFASPFYWLIAPMMRRFRALTTADVFELRFNRSVAMLYAVVSLALYSVNIGVMLKGSSAVIDATTGGSVNAEWAIALMTVLFVVYGVAGGLGAAIITDFLQGVLTIFFSFLLLPYIFHAVGGMEGLQQSVPQAAPDRNMFSLVAPEDIGLFYIIVIALNALVGIVTQPHTMGNCAAGRTELDGQVGFMCGSLIKRVCTIAWCLTGLAAVAYFADTEIHPDKVFGQVARDILPGVMPGMLGLFIAGLLASVMSSCDAFMVSSAGLFAENLYKPLAPGRSPRHYLWVARLSSLVVVVGGVAFAYWVEDVVKGLEIFWKISPMLGVAFWLGLFWRRMTSAGAWAATLAALGTWWLSAQSLVIEWIAGCPAAESLRLVVEADGEKALYLPWQMVFYLGAGLVSGVVVSLLTPSVNEKKLERYFALIRTPIQPSEVIPAPCTLPKGVQVPPRRMLVSAWGLEIPMPSTQAIFGFLVGWVCVAAIIGAFIWIVQGC